MHKIDKTKMRIIILELLEEENLNNPAKLVEMLRLAHEKSILYKYFSESEHQEPSTEDSQEELGISSANEESDIENTIDFVPEKVEEIKNIPVEKHTENEIIDENDNDFAGIKETVAPGKKSESVEQENLSFEERIKQILANAPKVEKKQDDFTKKKPEIGSESISNTPSTKNENTTDIETFEKTGQHTASFEEEFKDAISADYAAELFDRTTPANEQTKTLNDKLSGNHLVVGLNDRIAFVKHLFNGDLYAFNQAIEHLQECRTREQAESYILNELKTKLQWSEDNQTYEERFIDIVMRKFG